MTNLSGIDLKAIAPVDTAGLEDGGRHARITHQPDGFIKLLEEELDVPDVVAEAQWKQVLYFLATLWTMLRAGMFMPGQRPIQLPPRLATVWRIFCKSEHYALFASAFWPNVDICWRVYSTYLSEERLTQDLMRLIIETARTIGFPVDEWLWEYDTSITGSPHMLPYTAGVINDTIETIRNGGVIFQAGDGNWQVAYDEERFRPVGNWQGCEYVDPGRYVIWTLIAPDGADRWETRQEAIQVTEGALEPIV